MIKPLFFFRSSSSFLVFHSSGFERTLCGGQWETGQYTSSRTDQKVVLFKTDFQIGSGARYGCCPPGKFMSSPFLNPFSVINSCKSCPEEFSSALFEEPDQVHQNLSAQQLITAIHRAEDHIRRSNTYGN